MSQTLYIVSDLHLGGAPATATSPDFRMCSEEGQARLAEFFRWVAGRTSAGQVHLLLAGDIVDFLAEEPFSPFTADDQAACGKLGAILGRTSEVWKALREVVQAGAALTLLLGNHDPELSLPGPRRMLRQALGPGNVEFLYDNQAFSLGQVLVEHGNQHDGWNVVPPDKLRRLRALLSRGRRPSPGDVPAVPGSELVVRVMNKIKRDHAFVDLLKPECHAMLPLLAVLDPGRLADIHMAGGLFLKSLKALVHPGWKIGGTNPDGTPGDAEETAEDDGVGPPDQAEQSMKEALQLAATLSGAPDPHLIGGAKPAAAPSLSLSTETQVKLLYPALRYLGRQQIETFAINHEVKTYLDPARQAAARGFKVVVFGHTHLARQVPIPEHGAVYINTGTWADLMAIPPSVLGEDEAAARGDLTRLVEALKQKQVKAWRRQVPSYARIRLSAQHEVEEARLLFFHGSAAPEVVPGPGEQALWSFAR